MKWIFVLMGTVLAGCSQSEHTLTGQIAVIGNPGDFITWERAEGKNDFCQTAEGFQDIAKETPITIYNKGQDVIAIGRLDEGVSDSVAGSEACIFSFVVDEIPKVDIYTIEISNKVQQQYSFEDLESENWEVSYALRSSEP